MPLKDYQFFINKEGYMIGEHSRECTSCGIMFPHERTKNHQSTCPSCRSKAGWKKMTPEERILKGAKARAKQKGLEFDLSLEDIVIPDVCPILNLPLMVNERTGGKDNSPSIDRIDNARGYTKDNIQIISNLANQMKNSATREQLRLFAEWIAKHLSA